MLERLLSALSKPAGNAVLAIVLISLVVTNAGVMILYFMGGLK